MYRIDHIPIYLLLICAALCAPSSADDHESADTDSLHSLMEHYNPSASPFESPFKDGTSANVTVNMLIREFQIDPAQMELNAGVTFRANWIDSRLVHTGRTPTPMDPDRIWRPDVFFQDEKRAHFHNIMKPNVLFRVSPGGEVSLSCRISLTLACQMDFGWFPMESQSCRIRMSSYTHTTVELNLQWRNDTPVQLPPPGLHLLTTNKFRLEELKVNKSVATTSTGNYTSLIATLVFKRALTSYIWHYFLPTFGLVALSWIVFWLHPVLVTPRIIVGLSTLLATLYFQATTIPSSAIFTTSADIWGTMCELLIALSLLETMTVHYLHEREQLHDDLTKPVRLTIEDGSSGVPLMERSDSPSKRHFFRVANDNRMDVLSRILFPGLFLLLSSIFWAVCLS